MLVASAALADEPANQTRPPVARAHRLAAERLRLVLVAAAAVGALVLPWEGVQLTPSLRAWSVYLALAAVPGVGHVTCGALECGLLLVALASCARHGWARTAAMRWCGLALVAVPLLYALTTRVAGGVLMFHLAQDNDEVAFLARNGANVAVGSPTTSFSGLNLDPTTTMLLRGLRLGWYLSVAAGMLLAGTHRVPRPSAPIIATGVAGAGLVLVGLALGLLGQQDELASTQALAAGRPAAALSKMASAFSVSPQLSESNAAEQTIGEADLELGEHSPAAYYVQALQATGEVAGAGEAPSPTALTESLVLLGKASSLAPANAVIAQQYDLALANAVLQRGALVLHYAASQTSSLIVAWTMGRSLYYLGDDQLATRYLRQAEEDTTNMEMRSNALTYIALAEDRMGNVMAFRSDIVTAVKEDPADLNVIARETAAGLFLPSWT